MFPLSPGLLVGISIALSAAGTWHYVRDTVRGKTKPNRVTWFMWALAPITASIVSYFTGGDGWSALKVFSAGFFPAVIFIASFYNPQSYWKLSIFDITCGVLSFAALVIWLGVNKVALAVGLAIAGDLFASLPTLVKTWKYPGTETVSAYMFYAVSFAPSLLALSIWNFENAAFQLYLLALNIVLVGFVFRKLFAPSVS